MKGLRIATDLAIALLLIAVLLWCAFLFWGAYSQHRVAVLLNRTALDEIVKNITNQPNGTPVETAVTEQIARLSNAQQELFDANTVSFLFQFLALVLVTIGVAILGVTYRLYKQTRDESAHVTERHARIQETMATFVRSRDNALFLAVDYTWVHALSRLLPLHDERGREQLLVMMSDSLRDIERHLENAVRERMGLEEDLLVDLLVDAGMRTEKYLEGHLDTAQAQEKEMTKRILLLNSRCLEILREHADEFVGRYQTYTETIAGAQEPVGREGQAPR